MTLYEINQILKIDLDIEDAEVCARRYIERNEIPERYAKAIEVVEINDDTIICDLTQFVRQHRNEIASYIRHEYESNEKALAFYAPILGDGDIIRPDAGEAVFYFIKYEIEDFFQCERGDA